MVNQIFNERSMDDALDALGKNFTTSERRYINETGIQPFYRTLKVNVANRSVSYRDTKYTPRRDDLVNAIAVNIGKDDSAEVGFTKKSKKAYLARFMNDGWDVRNQYGGPWTHVEGEHFWEKTQSEMGNTVKSAELKALLDVIHKRGLP